MKVINSKHLLKIYLNICDNKKQDLFFNIYK